MEYCAKCGNYRGPGKGETMMGTSCPTNGGHDWQPWERPALAVTMTAGGRMPVQVQ